MKSLVERFVGLRQDDRGLGVVTVLFVAAVISALAITATSVTVSNLGNARRDRQSLTAMATSEAGVAQATQFLRSGNLNALTCMEPAPGATPGATCQGPSTSWISATNPMQVNVDGTTGACVASRDCFKVWIGTRTPYVPNCPARHAVPAGSCSGLYRIHSTGLSGNGPGARKVAVDVKVTPYPFPMGVFSEQGFSGNGTVTVQSESVFTNGCISTRQDDSHSGSGFQFLWDAANNRPQLDLIYDQPAAAHSTQSISSANNTCGSGSGGGPIHQTSPCNPIFKYDQDSGGNALSSSDACYGAYTRSDGSPYPTTSKFTQADLQSYGYRPRGLTDAQYDALKAQSVAQGTYNIAVGSIYTVLTSLSAAGVTSPVLYWDNGSVSLGSTNFPAAYLRDVSSTAGCLNQSVTMVVSGPGHGLSYAGGNSGAPYLVASIFVPDGTLSGGGGRNMIGTAFAKTIDLGGNIDFMMDQCFASNPPGGTLDVQVVGWREDDARDIN